MISWKYYNKSDLINNLRKCDWSQFNDLDLDQKAVLIKNNIINSVKPLIKVVNVKMNIAQKKWFNNDLKLLKREKFNSYQKYLKRENWK